VAEYLTIPDIVESEPLTGMSVAADGVTFTVFIGVGETVVRLMRANADGEHIPLVVLTTDAQILALDSVYVTAVWVGGEPPTAQVTFLAQAVRFV